MLIKNTIGKKEQSTLSDLSKHFEVHSNQIIKWKRKFLDNASKAFKGTSKQGQEKKMEKLYTKIGELEVERDFLKKKSL
ncbi:MAG: transposase [Tenacibaculum sp.]